MTRYQVTVTRLNTNTYVQVEESETTSHVTNVSESNGILRLVKLSGSEVWYAPGQWIKVESVKQS